MSGRWADVSPHQIVMFLVFMPTTFISDFIWLFLLLLLLNPPVFIASSGVQRLALYRIGFLPFPSSLLNERLLKMAEKSEVIPLDDSIAHDIEALRKPVQENVWERSCTSYLLWYKFKVIHLHIKRDVTLDEDWTVGESLETIFHQYPRSLYKIAVLEVLSGLSPALLCWMKLQGQNLVLVS